STDSISSSYRQGKQQDDRKCNRENHLDKVCLGGRSSRPAPEETDGVCDEQQTTAFGELCTLTITADMPYIHLTLTIENEDYKALGLDLRERTRTVTLPAMVDTGCQSCLIGVISDRFPTLGEVNLATSDPWPVADDDEEGDLAWCAAGLESLQSVTWDHVREAMSSRVDMRTVEEKAADSSRESRTGMPVAIRGFHQYREDITSADGVVLCKDRCVFGRPIRDFIPIAPGRYRDVPKMATPPHEPVGKQLRGTEAVSFSNGHSLG
ncbi:unnamed protein product, partial [Gadus morhua 'NCC']